MYTRIGEHLIQVVTDSNNLMTWIRRNFPRIDDHCINTLDMVIHIEEGYGVPFIDYEVDITKETNKIIFCRADYLIEAEVDYKHAKISVHNELALKHALINLYSSYVVYHNWGLVIHSSCVVESGKAHLFAGHSGAGKSTAARLSYPREILSDEASIIKIIPDEITVYNSPFRSELEVTNAEGLYPLESIQILFQSLHNKRTNLRKANALLLLMDKVFYWAHNAEETGKILGLLRVLTNAVPIYELHFQNNNTFWELIS